MPWNVGGLKLLHSLIFTSSYSIKIINHTTTDKKQRSSKQNVPSQILTLFFIFYFQKWGTAHRAFALQAPTWAQYTRFHDTSSLPVVIFEFRAKSNSLALPGAPHPCHTHIHTKCCILCRLQIPKHFFTSFALRQNMYLQPLQ